MEAVGQRELAVSTFNRVWELLELPERTPWETDEMIHAAHVSCYVWSQIGTPANVARSEWQCARVYATLGRAEPGLWHASRSLELNDAGGEGFEDWDLPSAQQGMAHAHLAAGKTDEAQRWAARAREELAHVEDPEDRELIESQIAALALT